jgi:hypothetical protein
MTGGLATLPEEICKETIAEWNDATGDYVRGKMFAKIQFVTDTDLVTGGRIHALVTSELHINGEERKRQFWEDHGGRSTVRNTVRKKKTNGTECHEAGIQRQVECWYDFLLSLSLCC